LAHLTYVKVASVCIQDHCDKWSHAEKVSLPAQQTFMKESSMADPGNSPNDEEERIPAMQSLLENPFLLLFIGVAMPTVFYIVWGIMEIVSVPIAQ
jgi:hypothetical protein